MKRMMAIRTGVPVKMVEAVCAGDDEFEIVPVFPPKIIKGSSARLKSLVQLSPEKLGVVPGPERVDIDLIAHLVQGGLVGQGIDRPGQVDGHETRNQRAGYGPGRVGGGLVDNDTAPAAPAEGVPECLGLDLQEVRPRTRKSGWGRVLGSLMRTGPV